MFANIRPAYLYNELKDACPLKQEVIGDGFDMVIMRELTGGLYFGERHTEEVNGVVTATDTLTYNEEEIRSSHSGIMLPRLQIQGTFFLNHMQSQRLCLLHFPS